MSSEQEQQESEDILPRGTGTVNIIGTNNSSGDELRWEDMCVHACVVCLPCVFESMGIGLAVQILVCLYLCGVCISLCM